MVGSVALGWRSVLDGLALSSYKSNDWYQIFSASICSLTLFHSPVTLVAQISLRNPSTMIILLPPGAEIVLMHNLNADLDHLEFSFISAASLISSRRKTLTLPSSKDHNGCHQGVPTLSRTKSQPSW